MRTLVLVPVPPQGRRFDGRGNGARRPALHAPADRLAEAEALARAIGLDVRSALIVPLHQPRPATLLGKGKVEEIGRAAEAEGAGLIVIDHAVSPIQQRNLEKAWNAKVLDRTGLILEIFGARAATREGRLQVELAHLTYQKSRLVRSWTHLERQRGGYGFLGGPGETQIETDRRLINERIDKIRSELDVVVKTRALHRRGRSRVPYPVVAIVGYTNAGKSTLFNRLTGAAVDARDQVFATLDPTMREVELAGGRRIILSDTVGFISDLPTMLVAAFRATLEEVVAADLVLHVRDISHAESAAQREDVEAVLADLGIDAERRGRLIEVWNKIDRLSPPEREGVENAARRQDHVPILVSARTGEGLDRLLADIEARLSEREEVIELTLPPSAGRLTHWLHENAEVLGREPAHAGSTRYRVRIDRAKKARLDARLAREGLSGA
jgi:GTP-binding protein HflX